MTETGVPFAVAEALTPALSAQFVAMNENEIGFPTSTVKPEPGESSQTCGLVLHETALPTLSRPPLAVTVASDDFGSTLSSSSAFSPTAVADGKAAFASAAAPATCGVAIEVPLRYWYDPPGHVE